MKYGVCFAFLAIAVFVTAIQGGVGYIVPVVLLSEVFRSSSMLFINPSLAFRNFCCVDKSTSRDHWKASNWNGSDSNADSSDAKAKMGD